MALIAVQTIGEAGLEAAYSNAGAGGDEVVNQRGMFLHVDNTSVSSRTVTVAVQDPSTSFPTWGTVTKGAIVVQIDAGKQKFIGPFPPGPYNDANQRIQITYDSEAGVRLAALVAP